MLKRFVFVFCMFASVLILVGEEAPVPVGVQKAIALRKAAMQESWKDILAVDAWKRHEEVMRLQCVLQVAQAMSEVFDSSFSSIGSQYVEFAIRDEKQSGASAGTALFTKLIDLKQQFPGLLKELQSVFDRMDTAARGQKVTLDDLLPFFDEVAATYASIEDVYLHLFKIEWQLAEVSSRSKGKILSIESGEPGSLEEAQKLRDWIGMEFPRLVGTPYVDGAWTSAKCDAAYRAAIEGRRLLQDQYKQTPQGFTEALDQEYRWGFSVGNLLTLELRDLRSAVLKLYGELPKSNEMTAVPLDFREKFKAIQQKLLQCVLSMPLKLIALQRFELVEKGVASFSQKDLEQGKLPYILLFEWKPYSKGKYRVSINEADTGFGVATGTNVSARLGYLVSPDPEKKFSFPAGRVHLFSKKGDEFQSVPGFQSPDFEPFTKRLDEKARLKADFLSEFRYVELGTLLQGQYRVQWKTATGITLNRNILVHGQKE